MPVIYQPKERLIIEADRGDDYLVRNIDTGRGYLMDKLVFRHRYEATMNVEKLTDTEEDW